ncbi:hypothetical protein GF337_14095, partial [candidate division KSB1 bacterium]|nr:hypothetical protein [candidate division KSB1 bacterium]
MADKYIISHDLGTSSDKAILVNVHGEIIDIARECYPIYHPHPGHAEQEPEDWWQAVCKTTRDVLEKTGIKPADVVGMTFSAQMQGLIPVNKACVPLTPAITWLDGRSADIMREEMWTPPRVLGYNIFKLLKFIRITGGSPGQAGKDQIGKILWLEKYKPDLFEKTYKYLDVKDYIIYKLTGNLVTSVDLAVVWWLLDTRKNKNEWHPDLCKFANITVDQL